MKKTSAEIMNEVAALIEQSEQGTVPTVRVGRRPKNVSRGVDETRMALSSGLQDWILDMTIASQEAGINTDHKSFFFQDVNSSETNYDHLGVAKVELVGRQIVPKYEEGTYAGCELVKQPVKVVVRSALYEFFLNKTLIPVRINRDDFADPQDMLSAYQSCLQAVWRGTEFKGVLMGNLKQRDPILWIAKDIAALKEVFGYNILLDQNPFKVPDLWRTPSIMVPTKPGNVRVCFVDKQEIYGVPMNDGCLYARIKLFHRTMGQKERELMVKGCAQVRISRKGLPAVKGNMYMDDFRFFEMCRGLGLNPFTFDVICTFDNVKNKNHGLNHGDILEIPIEDYRIIGLSSKRSKSSYGVQLTCMGRQIDLFSDILKEKGIEEKAALIRDAMSGRLEAVAKVFETTGTVNDDDREEYMRCALFPIFRDGDWYIPMYTKNVSSLYVRLNRMLSAELLKFKVSNYAPYIMPWERLDEIEAALHEKGEIVRFYCPPSSKRVKGDIRTFAHTVIGSNPVVAPFSIQTFIPLRKNVLLTGEYTGKPEIDGPIVFNSSRDTIEISNQSAYMMFRDFDGDKVTVCFTNCTPPRTYRTVVMPEGEKGKFEPPTDMKLAIQHLLNVSAAIAQAAVDTGKVDLACREVYVDRLNKATATGDDKWFLNLKQAYEIGHKREKEIQGLKHTTGGTKSHDASYEIKQQYGLFSPDTKREQSLEYQFLHRHAGLEKHMASDMNIFNKRIEIINTGKLNPRLPHYAGFILLKDHKIEVRHRDSIFIRNVMEKVWERAEQYWVDHHKEEGWIFTPNGVKRYGNLLAEYFSIMSNAVREEYRQTRNKERRVEGFRYIGKNIRTAGMRLVRNTGRRDENGEIITEVKSYHSISKMKELMGDSAGDWEKYLAVYLCYHCFGGSEEAYVRFDGAIVEPFSLGGGPLGYLSDDAKLFAARKFNPDNPELKRAAKKLSSLEKKALIPEEEEEY